MVLKVLSPPLWGDWDFLFKVGTVEEKYIVGIHIVEGIDRWTDTVTTLSPHIGVIPYQGLI